MPTDISKILTASISLLNEKLHFEEKLKEMDLCYGTFKL